MQPLLLLVALLAVVSDVVVGQYQLCSEGQNPPYCICGTERQANDMALQFAVSPNPPYLGGFTTNFNITFGMTLDREFTLSTSSSVLMTPYLNGVANDPENLIKANVLTPAPPWPAGVTQVQASMLCRFPFCNGPLAQTFWQIQFIDQDGTELLCIRTQIWS